MEISGYNQLNDDERELVDFIVEMIECIFEAVDDRKIDGMHYMQCMSIMITMASEAIYTNHIHDKEALHIIIESVKAGYRTYMTNKEYNGQTESIGE